MKLWVVLLGFLVGGSVTLGHAPLDSSVPLRKAFNKENGPNRHTRMGRQNEVSQILQPMKYSESNLYKLPSKNETIEEGLIEKINNKSSADNLNSDSSVHPYKSQGSALKKNKQKGHYIFSNGIVQFVAYTTPPPKTVTTTSKTIAAYDMFREIISEATTRHTYDSNSTTDSSYASNSTTDSSYASNSTTDSSYASNSTTDSSYASNSTTDSPDNSNSTTDSPDDSNSTTESPYDNTTSDVYDTTRDTFDNTRWKSTDSATRVLFGTSTEVDGGTTMARDFTIPVSDVTTETLNGLTGLEADSVDVEEFEDKFMKSTSHVTKSSRLTDEFQRIDDRLRTESSVMSVEMPQQTADENTAASKNSFNHVSTWNLTSLHPLFLQSTWRPQTSPPTTMPLPTKERGMGETRSWAALDEGLYVKTTTRRPFTPPTSTSVSWPFFDVEGESKRPLENSSETTELHVISPAGNDPGWGQHDDNLYVETATGKPLTHPVTTTTNTPDEVGSWIELEDGLYIRTSTRQPFTRPVKTRDPSTTVSDSVIPMSILTTTTATIPVTAADTVKPNATNEEPTSMENLWEKVSQWFMFEKIPNITSTKWTFSQNSAPVNLPSLPPSDNDTNTSGSLSGGIDSLFQPIASGSTEHLASSFPISDQGTLDRIMQLTNILNKNFSDGGQSPVLSTSHHTPTSPETSKNTPIPITFHKQKSTHKPPPFHAPTPPSRPIITNQPMMSDSTVTSPPWALPLSLLNMKTTETKFQWPSTTASDIIGQTPSNLSTDTGQSTPETESLLPFDETQVQKPNLSLILQYFDKSVPTERTKISSSSPVTKNRISTTPPWENPSHPLYIRTTTRRPFRPLTAEIASTTIPGVDKRITNYGGFGNIVSQNSNALPAEQIPGAVTISSESSTDSINPNPFATTQSSAMNSEFNNTAAYFPAAFTTEATDSSFKDSYSNPYFDIPFIKPSLRRQPSHILAAPTNSPATVLVPLTPFGHLVSTTADDGTRDKPSVSMVSYLNSDLPLKMKITPLPGKPQGMREEATEPPRALPTRQLTQSASKQESPIILYDYYKKNTSPYTGVKHIPLNVNNDSTQVFKDANILSVTPAFNSPISEPQSNKKASGSSVQQMTDKLQERTSPQPPINWSLFPTREAQMTTVPPPESSTQGFMDSWSSKSWYSDLLKEKRTPTSDILSRESTDSLTDNLNNVHTTQKTSTVEPLNVTASVLSSSDSVDLYGIVNEVLSSYSIKTHKVPSFQDNSTKKAIYTQNDHPSINISNKKGISSFGSNKYGSQLKSPTVDDFQSAFTSRPPQYWYLHKHPSSGFTTPFPRNPYKQVTKPNSNHLPPTFYDNTHDHFPWRDPRPPSSAQELLMTFQDNEPYWTENNVHADHRLPFWNHSYSSIVPTETVTSQPVSEEPSESLKETMIPAEEEYHGSENVQVTAAQIERLENMLFDAAKKVLPKNSTDLDILGYLIDLVKKSPVKNKPGEITIPVIPETAGISIRPQHMGTDPLHLVFQGESTSDPLTESISVSSTVTSATVHTTANFHEQDPQDLSFTISPQSVQLHIVPDAMVTFVPPLELKDTLITKLDTFPTVLHQTAPDFPTSRPPALSSIHPSLVPDHPQPAFANLYVSGSYQYDDDTYADVQDDDYAYLDFFSSLETWYPALSSTSVSFATFGINPGITLFTTYLYPQSGDVSYSKYPLNDESMFSFVSNGIQNPTFVHLRTKYPGEVLTPTFHSQLLSLEQDKSNLNVGIRPTFTTYMNVHSQNQANFHLYPGQDDLDTVNDKPNQSLQSLHAHTNVYTFSAQTSANKQPGKTDMNIKPSVSAASLRPGASQVQNINYISTYSGTGPDHVSIDIRPNEANINIKPDHNIPNIASYYPGTQTTYTNINMHTAQPNVNIHPSKPLNQGTTDMKSSQFSTDTHPNQAGFDTLPDESSNYVPGHTGITTWASQVSHSIQPGQTNIFMHPSIFGITMQPGETDYNLQPGQASISILPDQVSVIVRPDQAGFIVRPDEVNIYVRPEEAGINIRPDNTGIYIRPDQAGINIRPEEVGINIRPNQAGFTIRPDEAGINIRPDQAGINIRPDQAVTNMSPTKASINMQPGETGINIRPGQAGIQIRPDQAGINMRPDQAGIQLRPDQAGINIRPDQASINIRPDLAGINIRPDQAGIYIRPDHAGINIRPDQAGINIRPDQAGIDIRPDQTGINIRPDQIGINIRPDQTGINIRPDHTGINIRPDQNGINIGPDQAGINIRPDQTGINIRPDQTGINIRPDQTGINIRPDQTGINIGPDQAGINIRPDQTGIYIGPDQAGINIRPDQTGINIRPDQTGINIRPDQTGINIRPDQAGINIRPDQTGINIRPDQTGINIRPDQAGINIRPDQAGINIRPDQTGINIRPDQAGIHIRPDEVGFDIKPDHISPNTHDHESYISIRPDQTSMHTRPSWFSVNNQHANISFQPAVIYVRPVVTEEANVNAQFGETHNLLGQNNMGIDSDETNVDIHSGDETFVSMDHTYVSNDPPIIDADITYGTHTPTMDISIWPEEVHTAVKPPQVPQITITSSDGALASDESKPSLPGKINHTSLSILPHDTHINVRPVYVTHPTLTSVTEPTTTDSVLQPTNINIKPHDMNSVSENVPSKPTTTTKPLLSTYPPSFDWVQQHLAEAPANIKPLLTSENFITFFSWFIGIMKYYTSITTTTTTTQKPEIGIQIPAGFLDKLLTQLTLLNDFPPSRPAFMEVLLGPENPLQIILQELLRVTDGDINQALAIVTSFSKAQSQQGTKDSSLSSIDVSPVTTNTIPTVTAGPPTQIYAQNFVTWPPVISPYFVNDTVSTQAFGSHSSLTTPVTTSLPPHETLQTFQSLVSNDDATQVSVTEESQHLQGSFTDPVMQSPSLSWEDNEVSSTQVSEPDHSQDTLGLVDLEKAELSELIHKVLKDYMAGKHANDSSTMDKNSHEYNHTRHVLADSPKDESVHHNPEELNVSVQAASSNIKKNTTSVKVMLEWADTMAAAILTPNNYANISISAPGNPNPETLIELLKGTLKEVLPRNTSSDGTYLNPFVLQEVLYQLTSEDQLTQSQELTTSSELSFSDLLSDYDKLALTTLYSVSVNNTKKRKQNLEGIDLVETSSIPSDLFMLPEPISAPKPVFISHNVRDYLTAAQAQMENFYPSEQDSFPLHQSSIPRDPETANADISISPTVVHFQQPIYQGDVSFPQRLSGSDNKSSANDLTFTPGLSTVGQFNTNNDELNNPFTEVKPTTSHSSSVSLKASTVPVDEIHKIKTNLSFYSFVQLSDTGFNDTVDIHSSQSMRYKDKTTLRPPVHEDPESLGVSHNNEDALFPIRPAFTRVGMQTTTPPTSFINPPTPMNLQPGLMYLQPQEVSPVYNTVTVTESPDVIVTLPPSLDNSVPSLDGLMSPNTVTVSATNAPEVDQVFYTTEANTDGEVTANGNISSGITLEESTSFYKPDPLLSTKIYDEDPVVTELSNLSNQVLVLQDLVFKILNNTSTSQNATPFTTSYPASPEWGNETAVQQPSVTDVLQIGNQAEESLSNSHASNEMEIMETTVQSPIYDKLLTSTEQISTNRPGGTFGNNIEQETDSLPESTAHMSGNPLYSLPKVPSSASNMAELRNNSFAQSPFLMVMNSFKDHGVVQLSNKDTANLDLPIQSPFLVVTTKPKDYLMPTEQSYGEGDVDMPLAPQGNNTETVSSLAEQISKILDSLSFNRPLSTSFISPEYLHAQNLTTKALGLLEEAIDLLKEKYGLLKHKDMANTLQTMENMQNLITHLVNESGSSDEKNHSAIHDYHELTSVSPNFGESFNRSDIFSSDTDEYSASDSEVDSVLKEILKWTPEPPITLAHQQTQATTQHLPDNNTISSDIQITETPPTPPFVTPIEQPQASTFSTPNPPLSFHTAHPSIFNPFLPQSINDTDFFKAPDGSMQNANKGTPHVTLVNTEWSRWPWKSTTFRPPQLTPVPTIPAPSLGDKLHHHDFLSFMHTINRNASRNNTAPLQTFQPQVLNLLSAFRPRLPSDAMKHSDANSPALQTSSEEDSTGIDISSTSTSNLSVVSLNNSGSSNSMAKYPFIGRPDAMTLGHIELEQNPPPQKDQGPFYLSNGNTDGVHPTSSSGIIYPAPPGYIVPNIKKPKPNNTFPAYPARQSNSTYTVPLQQVHPLHPGVPSYPNLPSASVTSSPGSASFIPPSSSQLSITNSLSLGILSSSPPNFPGYSYTSALDSSQPTVPSTSFPKIPSWNYDSVPVSGYQLLSGGSSRPLSNGLRRPVIPNIAQSPATFTANSGPPTATLSPVVESPSKDTGAYRCGGIGTAKVSNFLNPSYPLPDRGRSDCVFKLYILNPAICQVRVDFVDTSMLLPTRGECLEQRLSVGGTIRAPAVNAFCGRNTDQHFYIDLLDAGTPTDVEAGLGVGAGHRWVDFSVTTRSSLLQYRFGLWITQVACAGDPLRAPSGCLQYFMGPAGVIKSFNFEGGQYLNGQNYRICLRASRESCEVAFTAKNGDFGLQKLNSRLVPYDRAGVGPRACVRDYLYFPNLASDVLGVPPAPADGGVGVGGRVCGGKLSYIHGDATSRPVTGRIAGEMYVLYVRTGRPQVYNSVSHGPGFKLMYYQRAVCSLPRRSSGLTRQPAAHALEPPDYDPGPLIEESYAYARDSQGGGDDNPYFDDFLGDLPAPDFSSRFSGRIGESDQRSENETTLSHAPTRLSGGDQVVTTSSEEATEGLVGDIVEEALWDTLPELGASLGLLLRDKEGSRAEALARPAGQELPQGHVARKADERFLPGARKAVVRKAGETPYGDSFVVSLFSDFLAGASDASTLRPRASKVSELQDEAMGIWGVLGEEEGDLKASPPTPQSSKARRPDTEDSHVTAAEKNDDGFSIEGGRESQHNPSGGNSRVQEFDRASDNGLNFSRTSDISNIDGGSEDPDENRSALDLLSRAAVALAPGALTQRRVSGPEEKGEDGRAADETEGEEEEEEKEGKREEDIESIVPEISPGMFDEIPPRPSSSVFSKGKDRMRPSPRPSSGSLTPYPAAMRPVVRRVGDSKTSDTFIISWLSGLSAPPSVEGRPGSGDASDGEAMRDSRRRRDTEGVRSPEDPAADAAPSEPGRSARFTDFVTWYPQAGDAQPTDAPQQAVFTPTELYKRLLLVKTPTRGGPSATDVTSKPYYVRPNTRSEVGAAADFSDDIDAAQSGYGDTGWSDLVTWYPELNEPFVTWSHVAERQRRPKELSYL